MLDIFKNGKVLIVFIGFLIFGVILSAQFKSTFYNKMQGSSRKLEVEQLNVMLKEEKDTINKLMASIDQNEKMRNQYLKNAIHRAEDNHLTRDLEILNDLEVIAGLTDVTGPGIIIKMDDAPARVNYPMEFLIIHDSDIKLILNELKIAGAQAISINDERVMATSEQVCAGPTILINKNRYPVPYTIKVIGDMETLYRTVDESDRIGLMRRDGIKISIEKSKSLEIPKFRHDLSSLVAGLEVAE